MRNTTFVRTLFCYISIFCLASFSLIFLPAFAQDATPAAISAKEAPAATALPSDPKELMLLAAKSNGLIGDDMKPWHLKVSWKMLDETGGITDQGTYEEFWVSETKYKLTCTNKTSSRTKYGTERGVLISDNEAPVNTHDLRRQLLFPMPDAHSIESSDYVLSKESFDENEFYCLNKKGASGSPYGPTYCLDTQRPILISSEYGGAERTFRSTIVSFQNHYIAGDLQIFYGGNGSQTAHLDSIETLDPIDEAVFTPPSSAVPQKVEVRTINIDKVNVASGIMAGRLIKKVQPGYPLSAKEQGIQGLVVLQAIITKEGRIRDLHVISGPEILQKPAMDAVKKWVYRPYLLNGEPVEVMTTINVIFTLGR
jgi:TonB family protein